MTKVNGIILIVFIVASCKTNSHKQVESNLFFTTYNELKIDDELTSILYFKNHFFIAQANSKIAVLDTFFKRQYSIENLINKFPISNIFLTNDSLKVFKSDDNRIGYPETYYLANDFKLNLIKENFESYEGICLGYPLYEDSSYNIYANRIGEWGFFTYFQNKLSKKIFALYSYKPRQVVKFKKTYYLLCDGMKHDTTNTGVIKIDNPDKLYKITSKQVEKLNILFTHLATSPGKEYEILANKIEKNSYVNYGFQDRYSIPIYTFEKGGNLYTIVRNDSSIYLGQHLKNSFQKIQNLFDTSFVIDRISTCTYKNNTIISFNYSGGEGSNGMMVDFFDCGFFVIQNSKIDLYRLYRESKTKW